jgi:hypothetical protein
MTSSSRPSSEFTAVGDNEVEEGGGEERRLIETTNYSLRVLEFK